MESTIMISNGTNYPAYTADDAKLLALKNDVLSSELDAANAEIERLRKVNKCYRRRINRAYAQAIMYQARQPHPVVGFAVGIMFLMSLTGIVLMIV